MTIVAELSGFCKARAIWTWCRAEKRCRIRATLDGIPLLDIADPRIDVIADALIAARLLPEKARSDAEHVAISTVHGVEYLLTWNCRHIANADTLPREYRLLTDMGYSPPLIVTPEEFPEMHKPLYDDPIVAKVHAIRAQMLADCDGDHHKLMEQVRERQRGSDRTIIAAPSLARSTEQSVGPDGE